MDFREERLAWTILLPVPFRSVSRIKEMVGVEGDMMGGGGGPRICIRRSSASTHVLTI